MYKLMYMAFLTHAHMNKQFVSAINQLCVERNIPKEYVVEAILSALKTAYRKDYGNKEENIEVDLDEETGAFMVFLVKDVVAEVEDEFNELTVEQAQKYRKNAKPGDHIHIEVTPSGFGRIAAQAAKQVILQKIQEAERDMVFETFKEREDELLTAQVSRVDRGQVYLEIDRNTVMFPREFRVPSERYYAGQRLKIYLEKVEKTTKGPQLIITRKAPKLVEKLFEFEIPEIKTGVIEIKGIARDAGVRSKVAVKSNDEKIDPIGACVGQRGVRIQTIMDELNGEMIDVVEYSDDIHEYIKQALAPAKIGVMDIDKEEKVAEVYVESDQRPLAIGRNGQNVRLASFLTGYEINLHDLSEYKGGVPGAPAPEDEAEEIPAEDLPETDATMADLDLTDSIKKKLEAAGIEDVNVLRKMSKEDLTMIGGIGKAGADKIFKAAREV